MTHRRSFIASIFALPVGSLPLPAARMSLLAQFQWIRQTVQNDTEELFGLPFTTVARMDYRTASEMADQYAKISALCKGLQSPRN